MCPSSHSSIRLMIQIMAILYKGGKGTFPSSLQLHLQRRRKYADSTAAEEEPRLLGTVENKLGIEKWCKENNHE